jgi:hypothetical protein
MKTQHGPPRLGGRPAQEGVGVGNLPPCIRADLAAQRTTWRRQLHSPPLECATPAIEPLELSDILGKTLPVDFLAAWAGRRGATLHISGEVAR